jgi:hypothetical protein
MDGSSRTSNRSPERSADNRRCDHFSPTSVPGRWRARRRGGGERPPAGCMTVLRQGRDRATPSITVPNAIGTPTPGCSAGHGTMRTIARSLAVRRGRVVSERVLDHPDLPELCGQIDRELLDRCLVGLLVCGQGRLPVVLRPVHVEQHPGPQVPRLDFRVVAVSQEQCGAQGLLDSSLSVSVTRRPESRSRFSVRRRFGLLR